MMIKFTSKLIYYRVCFLACVIAACPWCQSENIQRSKPAQYQARLKTREDRHLSPFTGYSRDHWLEITEQLIAGVLPCFNTPNGMPVFKGVAGETGHFSLCTPTSPIDPLERIMMLSIFYTAATGRDAVPGYSGSITAPFLKAITQGTNPQNPAYWGRVDKTVTGEGSVIAMAILLSPRYFWDPLTSQQKKNVLAFLQDVNNAHGYDNNHHYFHMMPAPALESNGVPSNREYLTQLFERTLYMYRGDGWFIDGSNGGFDYYNLWGFQLFANALCRLDPVWRREFGERVNHISAQFQKSLPYLYGRDGGPVPFGRSLAYRFASNAAIGWAVLNRSNTLPPGQARRIASGCLKFFWEHGCLSENGLLEVGYLGPNSVVAEPYIDHGVPYWAAQGLVPLLIPATDPYWTEMEKPMPADGVGGTIPLPNAQMTVRVRPLDGEVRLYPVGQPFTHFGAWQRGIKYCQLAYSSYMGWCSTGEGGPDLGAGRTGTSSDGINWHYRERPRAIQVAADQLISTEDIGEVTGDRDNTGQLVTHTLIGDKGGEVHVFWHTSPKPLYLYLGGYGISIPHGEALQKEAHQNKLLISGGNNYSIIRTLQVPSLRNPPGDLAADLLAPRPGWLHSHLYGGRGAFPYWHSRAPVPPNLPVVLYADAARERAPFDPAFSILQNQEVLQITFEGKVHRVRIPY